MASAVVCRAVLMFELAGMRNALYKQPELQPQQQLEDSKECDKQVKAASAKKTGRPVLIKIRGPSLS